MKRIHLILLAVLILLAIAFLAPKANAIDSTEKAALKSSLLN